MCAHARPHGGGTCMHAHADQTLSCLLKDVATPYKLTVYFTNSLLFDSLIQKRYLHVALDLLGTLYGPYRRLATITADFRVPYHQLATASEAIRASRK